MVSDHGTSKNDIRILNILDEENVAASLLNLLAKVKNVSLLFFEDLVDLSVVVDNDLVVHL